jgi:hypothetical protein
VSELPIRFKLFKGVAIVSVQEPSDGGDDDILELLDAALEGLIARDRYRIIVHLRNYGVGAFRDSVSRIVIAYDEEVREKGGAIKLVAEGCVDGALYDLLRRSLN